MIPNVTKLNRLSNENNLKKITNLTIGGEISRTSTAEIVNDFKLLDLSQVDQLEMIQIFRNRKQSITKYITIYKDLAKQ